MLLIRCAENRDLKGVWALAAHLDSMNLPRDKKVLRTLIHVSNASFSGKIPVKQRGRFLFVAEETEKKKIVGCAAIFTQHGTPERPHLYFQMRNETRHSRFLKRSFRRRYAVLKQSKKGPTEMCALVVLPAWRRRPEKIGQLVSFARYLYMWSHPEKFKRRLLSELNGVIRPDGGNDLWDAVGGRLTGLDYRTADHMSAVSKEFVLSLYPKTKFYLDLLPAKARRVIEQTGPGSQGALRLLKEIGFRYLRQCCPFDGGPHYGARWRDVKLFRRMKRGKAAPAIRPLELKMDGIVSSEKGGKFRAVRTSYELWKGAVRLPAETLTALAVLTGDPVTVLEMKR